MASGPSGRPDPGREEAARTSPPFDLLVNVGVGAAEQLNVEVEDTGDRLGRGRGRHPQQAEAEQSPAAERRGTDHESADHFPARALPSATSVSGGKFT